MSKFNWTRFYDELEEGEPAKFPYWLFFLDEMGQVFTKSVSGFVIGFFMSVVVIISMGVWTRILESHPNFVIKTFCSAYLPEQK